MLPHLCYVFDQNVVRATAYTVAAVLLVEVLAQILMLSVIGRSNLLVKGQIFDSAMTS
jgi:hypothetical protein